MQNLFSLIAWAFVKQMLWSLGIRETNAKALIKYKL
jgi:hypothetical protein